MLFELELIYIICMCVFSVVSDSVQPQTVARQVPMTLEFSWQEHWSRLSFPAPGDLPDPGIKPVSLASPKLAGRFFTTVPPGKSIYVIQFYNHDIALKFSK